MFKLLKAAVLVSLGATTFVVSVPAEAQSSCGRCGRQPSAAPAPRPAPAPRTAHPRRAQAPRIVYRDRVVYQDRVVQQQPQVVERIVQQQAAPFQNFNYGAGIDFIDTNTPNGSYAIMQEPARYEGGSSYQFAGSIYLEGPVNPTNPIVGGGTNPPAPGGQVGGDTNPANPGGGGAIPSPFPTSGSSVGGGTIPSGFPTPGYGSGNGYSGGGAPDGNTGVYTRVGPNGGSYIVGNGGNDLPAGFRYDNGAQTTYYVDGSSSSNIQSGYVTGNGSGGNNTVAVDGNTGLPATGSYSSTYQSGGGLPAGFQNGSVTNDPNAIGGGTGGRP